MPEESEEIVEAPQPQRIAPEAVGEVWAIVAHLACGRTVELRRCGDALEAANVHDLIERGFAVGMEELDLAQPMAGIRAQVEGAEAARRG